MDTTKTATEATPPPPTEAKPAETKATPPPAEPAAKPTEDTAMKTAAEAKSETESATEKRKKPEEEGGDDKDMSEGVKKLTKLVEEHSDVKALLQELSEKNKTNERIAEVYRKQAAKQFAEGQCLALGLSKGTPEFERRFGEQIQFAAQHPQVLEPLMDQIIARQAELLNPSTPAQGTKSAAPPKETAPPAPQEKKTAAPPPPQEKKPKKESFDFIQSLTRKTQSNLLEQELKGGSSSSSSSAEPPARSSATTESWTRVNTSQSTAAPSMNPFLKQMMEDLQVRRLMNQSQQLVTAKAGHENARHNEINSEIVERCKRWQPDHRSFDGVCPDRYTVAMPVWQGAKPWPAESLRT